MSSVNPMVWFGVAAVVALAIAAFASATAQGRTASAAMDAIWRQPEAAGRIQTAMMLALAFMEALTLFVLAVAFGLPAVLR
ncbi:MAG: ATP synthase F0 subunit C [Bacillota bacterium]